MVTKKQNEEKLYCRMCGKFFVPSAFYETTNPMLDKSGKLSICKSCCEDLYNKVFEIYKDEKLSLIITCEYLDIAFISKAFVQCQSHIKTLQDSGKSATAIFGYYKSKLSTCTKRNEQIDSLRFKDSDEDILSEYRHEQIKTDEEMSLPEGKRVNKEIRSYWGDNRDNWEYNFLQEELNKIQSSFECPDYGMEMLMRDICFINLDIEKIRQGYNKGDVSKLIETRSKLMNDAKMKPIQATGAEENEQVTFGTLIKKWETEKPVSQKLDDEMKKYIDTYMVGHLAKMQGLDCDLVDNYEKELKEYTVDFDALDEDGE